MESSILNKVKIIPPSLTISKEILWQIINNATSVLIVDINNQSILFANPNSIKELRIIENNDKLGISDVCGLKFKFPITFGEKFKIVLKTKHDPDILMEIDNFIITWDENPAYLLIIKSYINE